MKKKLFIAILVIAAMGLALMVSRGFLSKTGLIDNINKAERIITAGEHFFPEGIIVKKDEVLIIKPGAHLFMGKSARIKVKGKIIAKGTKQNPIIFSGNNAYWRGIKIEGGRQPDINKYKQFFMANKFENSDFIPSIKNGNIFLYCEFENLATEDKERNRLNRERGVIEAENTCLVVSFCGFDKDIFHIGCILPTNSLALISHNRITSKMVMKVIFARKSVIILHHNLIAPKRYEYQTWPDGICSENGMAIIGYNDFEGTADDAISSRDSLCFILRNNINRPFDDGLDIDNRSKAYIIDNYISQPYDEGILISDQASAILVDNNIRRVKADSNAVFPINTANAALTLRSGGKAYCRNLQVRDSDRGIYLKQEMPLVFSQEGFRLIKQAILRLSDEKISFTNIRCSSKQELIDLLDNSYEDYQGFKILNVRQGNKESNFMFLPRLSRKVFKLVGHEKIYRSDISNKMRDVLSGQVKERLANYINFLYIENSIIKDVKVPFVKEKPYYIKMREMKIEEDNIGDKEESTQQLFPNEIAKFAQDTKNADRKFNEVVRKKIYVERLIQVMETLVNEL